MKALWCSLVMATMLCSSYLVASTDQNQMRMRGGDENREVVDCNGSYRDFEDCDSMPNGNCEAHVWRIVYDDYMNTWFKPGDGACSGGPCIGELDSDPTLTRCVDWFWPTWYP